MAFKDNLKNKLASIQLWLLQIATLNGEKLLISEIGFDQMATKSKGSTEVNDNFLYFVSKSCELCKDNGSYVPTHEF